MRYFSRISGEKVDLDRKHPDITKRNLERLRRVMFIERYRIHPAITERNFERLRRVIFIERYRIHPAITERNEAWNIPRDTVRAGFNDDIK